LKVVFRESFREERSFDSLQFLVIVFIEIDLRGLLVWKWGVEVKEL
jgi:hypothetical protein